MMFLDLKSTTHVFRKNLWQHELHCYGTCGRCIQVHPLKDVYVQLYHVILHQCRTELNKLRASRGSTPSSRESHPVVNRRSSRAILLDDADGVLVCRDGREGHLAQPDQPREQSARALHRSESSVERTRTLRGHRTRGPRASSSSSGGPRAQ